MGSRIDANICYHLFLARLLRHLGTPAETVAPESFWRKRLGRSAEPAPGDQASQIAGGGCVTTAGECGMDDGALEIFPPDLGFFPQPTDEPPFVTSVDSHQPGPHLVVNALTHGNELCGALAIERLIQSRLRPARGRITFCLANVDAFRCFDPTQPALSRYLDEDFNRIWSDALLDGPGDSRERRRARQLRPLFRSADALLDLHSMQSDGPPMILCGRCDRGQALAARLGFPRILVADQGHGAGPRLIDYPPFNQDPGHQTALLVECGQHGKQASVDAAARTTLGFLTAYGVIEPSRWGFRQEPLDPTALQRVDVTHAVTATADDFVFVDDYGGLDVIDKAGTIIGYDGPQAVRTPYDHCVLVMPSHRVRKGQTAVRLGRIVSSFS